jgi:hypothetical protein
MSRLQALSRPIGVDVREEGKTQALELGEGCRWRHCLITSRVVEDRATFRVERRLLGRSKCPR